MPNADLTRLTDAELVAAAIDRSGLTAADFATATGRDPRTVERWLEGSPLASVVRKWLLRYVAGVAELLPARGDV